MNQEIVTLLGAMSFIFDEFRINHGSISDDDIATQALYALGYFAGNIIIEAPDAETKLRAQQALQEGLADAAMATLATKQ